jgi:hypothetical protein
MSENKPTPTPWEYIITGENEAKICGPTGQEVAFRIYLPNAELIVRACNNHDNLSWALMDAICEGIRLGSWHATDEKVEKWTNIASEAEEKA